MANSIPDFDHNLVLPPHLGDPRGPGQLSPYPCTTAELVQRFGVSHERREILRGFLGFRERLRATGLTRGFQWLDGSFLEDIETQEARPPRDLDVVTVFWDYDLAFQQTVFAAFPEFAHPAMAKANFALDHYPFDAGYRPEVTVEYARYWMLLFSHNRDGVWKGMLKIDLDTPDLDNEARKVLSPSST
jgi:hypothetical protein